MNGYITIIIINFCFSTILTVQMEEKIRHFPDESSGGERIIGGSDATRGQFPWQASIRRKAFNKHACGGAIIGPYWIITAAHCTQGPYKIPSNVSVVLGLHKVRKDGIIADVLMILLHPEMNFRDQSHDISMLRTKTKIIYSKNFIWPAAIPDYPAEEGTIVRISGWGYTDFSLESKNGTRPDILQFEQTTIISREECQNRYEMDKILHDSVHLHSVCTIDTAGHGTCHGDSGGPVVDSEDQLIGIVSWGKQCAKGFPDVHMSTYYHKEWIELVMRMYEEIEPSNL